MSEAHYRKKQPEQVRAQLLRVAIELIVGEGYESLTLDRVAKYAGVTKGGLLHHFPSKIALLQGVCDLLNETFGPIFDKALQDEPEGPKRNTKAYIRACFAEVDPLCTKAICILTLALPDYARQRGEWMQGLIEHDAMLPIDLAQALLLCRFAADGLWVAETAGVLRFDSETRSALLGRLLTLADSL